MPCDGIESVVMKPLSVDAFAKSRMRPSDDDEERDDEEQIDDIHVEILWRGVKLFSRADQ